DHLLGDARTIADDRGIFLPITWRLAPSICHLTSQQFYDVRLFAHPALDRLALNAGSDWPASGLAVVDVDHGGNPNASDEEAGNGERIVRQLPGGARWTDAKGEHAIGDRDILVVAPYNAHVTRLSARLNETGVRVRTVDQAQGKDAPGVIYFM